ncbi:hypothetical protein AKJ16_DCAP14052 [Drosera capensis]
MALWAISPAHLAVARKEVQQLWVTLETDYMEAAAGKLIWGILSTDSDTLLHVAADSIGDEKTIEG